jgi:hypothetical protein
MSIRQIARRFGHSRRKIREVRQESEPHPYTLPQDRLAPRLGPYKAWIEQTLAEDQQAPRKQQHTAAKLYRRLRDEHGYTGGYDQVRRYVGKVGRAQRETFLPLTHPPGRRLEADFGHLYVEHRVYDLQRDWATPVPRAQDLAELKAYLRSCALAKRAHVMAGKTQTIGELFEQDQQAALALPPRAFDPFVPEAIVQGRRKTTVNPDHIIATVHRLGDRRGACDAAPHVGTNPGDSSALPVPGL